MCFLHSSSYATVSVQRVLEHTEISYFLYQLAIRIRQIHCPTVSVTLCLGSWYKLRWNDCVAMLPRQGGREDKVFGRRKERDFLRVLLTTGA
jgi:hypothetical protein